MKKNKNWHNKGFVLVETLIATVFVSAIFIIIYMNFYPLIGEYEKRENYDDIESVYKTYWIKRLVEDSNYAEDPDTIENALNSGNGTYIEFKCNDSFTTDKISTCIRLFDKFGVQKVFITEFDLDDFKDVVEKNVNGIYDNDTKFGDYILYIPNFSRAKKKVDEDQKSYRILVKYKNSYSEFSNSSSKAEYYTFSNMEVGVDNE